MNHSSGRHHISSQSVRYNAIHRLTALVNGKLLLDPTVFISNDAPSNLSYPPQTATFCQQQTLNKGSTKEC